MAERRAAVALAAAGWTERQHVGASVEPRITGGGGLQVCPADRRHRGEIKAGEGLAQRQAGFGKVVVDGLAGAAVELELDERTSMIVTTNLAFAEWPSVSGATPR